jgi:hypothetical protein
MTEMESMQACTRNAEKIRMVDRRLAADAHRPIRDVRPVDEVSDHALDCGVPLVEQVG